MPTSKNKLGTKPGVRRTGSPDLARINRMLRAGISSNRRSASVNNVLSKVAETLDKLLLVESHAERIQMLAMNADVEVRRAADAEAIARAVDDDAYIQAIVFDAPEHGSRGWQNNQNAAARNEFMARAGGMLTSGQVADLLQSTAKNRAAKANHLKDKKRVFCVRHKGQDLYPGFQFDADNGRPYPEIERLIAALEPDYDTGWQMALWFTSANEWLDSATPLDFWPERRKEVVEAAVREAALFNA